MSQHKNFASDERAVDLRRLFRVLLKRSWIVIIVSTLCGLGAFFYSSWFVTPIYQASFSAYVNNRMLSESEIKTSSSDMSASMDLLYVYQDIITSRSVMQEAVSYCDSEDLGKASQAVQCVVSSKAPILRVYVTSESPELAYQLACAIELVAPDHVKAVVDGSSMRTIDSPRVSSNPVSPDISGNTVYALLMGFFGSVLLLVVLDLIHDKVQDADELESRYDIPVIGRIPDMHQMNDKGNDRSSPRKEAVEK